MEESQLKLLNVVMQGICFCLVFTGFNTLGGIQTLIFESAKDPKSEGYVEGFQGVGQWSLAIIYMMFTCCNWIAPSVVAVLGPRPTMVVGALTYAAFMAQMLVLNTYLLYASSALLGVGAAIIWTAQGNYLTLNSDDHTISRNSGMFWAMSISSSFFGNIFVFLQFTNKTDIDKDTRNLVGSVLLCVTGVGAGLLMLLRPTPWASGQTNVSPATALKDSGRLFVTRDMLLLCVTFFYTGIQLSIWSAVYGTCIGFTYAFGNEAKALATISGIFVAIGEVLGGAAFGIFGKLTVKGGRDPIVILGFCVSMLAYFLAFINLPNESTFKETTAQQLAFIDSNKYLAIFTSFLLGFSDACFNTQIFSILGGSFKEHSASAFAIFKFMQSFATSIAFWYAPLLSLYWQLLIAVVFDVLGTLAFCTVEWRRSKESELVIDNSCGLPEDTHKIE